MRFVLALFLCLFTYATFAQDTEKTAHFIKDKMNSQTFAEVYPLLSEGFQEKFSEAQFTNVLQSIAQRTGKVLELSRKSENVFELKGEKSVWTMSLVLGKEGKIEGLNFVPKPQSDPNKVVLSSNKLQSDLDKQVDALLRPFMQSQGSVGLSAAVIIGDKVYSYHYGESKINNKTLPQQQTIYEIGSITKTLTGSLLAIAVNEGKISLEDEINKFLPKDLPRLAFEGQPIRIKHLANHSSGLPGMPLNLFMHKNHDANNPFKHYADEDLFTFLKNFTPTKVPGTIHEYSNLATGLLGVILERVYQKSFEELLQEKICKPLQIKNMHLQSSAKQLEMMAQGHNATLALSPPWDFQALAAAGGIRADLDDMIAYAQNQINLRNSQLYDKISLAHQSTFQGAPNGEIGLFWVKTNVQGKSFHWHNGKTGGYSSFMAFEKNQKIAIVLLTNASNDPTQVGMQMMAQLLK